MRSRVNHDRFIVHRHELDGADYLKCLDCPDDPRPVAQLGFAWTVGDLMREMKDHAWQHDVSRRRGIPMTEFGR